MGRGRAGDGKRVGEKNCNSCCPSGRFSFVPQGNKKCGEKSASSLAGPGGATRTGTLPL